MNRLLLVFVIGLAGCGHFSTNPSRVKAWVEHPEWVDVFTSCSVKGSMLIYDESARRFHAYDAARCRERFIPASTFKIANMLIGLETGVITDENFVIKWDGVKRFVPEWNRDLRMSEAFRLSAVWYYQEVTRRIGQQRMQAWLERLSYGNAKAGPKIDTFWLDGDIRISQAEQIEFLWRLKHDRLPMQRRTMAITKIVMEIERIAFDKTDSNLAILRGKTGWANSNPKRIGWFVGWVERGGKTYYFATNIESERPGMQDAPKRVAITREILSRMKIYPAGRQ